MVLDSFLLSSCHFPKFRRLGAPSCEKRQAHPRESCAPLTDGFLRESLLPALSLLSLSPSPFLSAQPTPATSLPLTPASPPPPREPTMSNLPPGWDLDYDGSRWFYKFRSSGLTQYTFPQEGDEFPDFVDASAPAPTLAPEEKLESQQQVKRRGDTTVGNGRRSKSSGMSATGGPVSTTWEDDDDGDYGYFQPENFMFLGPGAYTDVSPLADEDDTDGPSSRTKRKDASPSMSKATTDTASDRVLSPPVSSISTPQPSRAEPVAERGELAVDSPPQIAATPGEPQVDLVSPPEVPMLDGREQLQELPAEPSFNPVGVVPEMPTDDTARAHIELHPDPVEMADNTVLAPIETFYMNMAELPSQTTPVEREEAEPPPQRRRATSQPVQRVYPFQPREDDDPDRPPTPLGPSPAPTPSPQPPTDATSQDQNPSLSPFTPSPMTTFVTSPPAQPKSDTPTPDTEESHPNGHPRSTSPQQPFKISRKPTIAGPKTGYRPFSPASGTSGGLESQTGTPSTDSSPWYPGQPGQTGTSPVPTPPATSPKRATGVAGIPHASGGPATKDADTPPPVPTKDTAPTNLTPGQPTHPGAPAGVAQGFQQRPHSNSLPGSLGPLGNPALSDVLQQFRGVPQSLQPGTPPPLPVAVPGKGKAKPKPRATPSPLGYAKRPSHQSTSPDQPTLGPTIISPPDPPSGRSAPEYPLSTPSPLEIRSSSYGAASNGSPQSQVQVQHQTVSPNRQGAPARGEQHVSGSYFPPQPPQPHGQLGRSVEGKGKGRASPPGPATDSPSGESPLNESRASAPAPARNPEPKPHVSSNFSSPGAQQAVSRPQQHQQSPLVPPKEPLPPQPKPHAPPQPAPRHDPALGHFLDPITEQPENEDAASLARKASQASQASSHRHSMPVMPTGYGNTQSHSVAPPRNSGTAQSKPQSVLLQQQQQQPGGAPANVAQPQPQPGVQGIRPPGAVAPLNARQGAPIQPNFQQQPVPSMYTPQPMHVVAGPPARTPPTQPPEKGKSKWLSKLLKPSKTSQKAPPPQQQYAWNGPFVIPPNQSPVPAAPWSPGSVGATLAPPPPAGGQAHGSAAPLQQVPPNHPPGFQTMNDGQMHQQQASGGWRVVSMSVGQPGSKQPAPMKPKSGQSQASPPKPAPPLSQPPHPLTMNPVVQSTPQSKAGPISTSQPTQSTSTKGPPVSMENAQSPSDTGPGRSESVKSNLTNGPARTESVRSDFTTISTSEAQAQPVLKPQIVQVSRPNSSQRASQPPQIRYEPAQSPLDVHPNGQPAQRSDGLRALPHHLQNRLSADGPSARESMVSEVSSTDSMDSRRVSVLSTGSATPRNRGARTGDYSGDGWGDDS